MNKKLFSNVCKTNKSNAGVKVPEIIGDRKTISEEKNKITPGSVSGTDVEWRVMKLQNAIRNAAAKIVDELEGLKIENSNQKFQIDQKFVKQIIKEIEETEEVDDLEALKAAASYMHKRLQKGVQSLIKVGTIEENSNNSLVLRVNDITHAKQFLEEILKIERLETVKRKTEDFMKENLMSRLGGQLIEPIHPYPDGWVYSEKDTSQKTSNNPFSGVAERIRSRSNHELKGINAMHTTNSLGMITETSVVDQIKLDGKAAIKRTAARKVVKIARDMLVGAISVGKTKKEITSIRNTVASFLEKEEGKAVIGFILGTFLPFVKEKLPKKYWEAVDEMSREFRVESMSCFTDKITDFMAGPAFETARIMFQNILDQTIDDSDTKVRVVTSTSSDKPKSESESEEHIFSKEKTRVHS